MRWNLYRWLFGVAHRIGGRPAVWFVVTAWLAATFIGIYGFTLSPSLTSFGRTRSCSCAGIVTTLQLLLVCGLNTAETIRARDSTK